MNAVTGIGRVHMDSVLYNTPMKGLGSGDGGKIFNCGCWEALPNCSSFSEVHTTFCNLDGPKTSGAEQGK